MYGIGLAAEGINRGIEQHRQIKRQETEDEQRRKMQEMQMQNYGLQMDSTRQQMGQRATQMGWQGEDRARANAERDEQDLISATMGDLALGNYDRAVNNMAKFYGFKRGTHAPGEDGHLVVSFFDDDESEEPSLVEDLNPDELFHLGRNDPTGLMQRAMTQRQAIAQARQEATEAAEQARIEHQRKLEIEAMKGGSTVGGYNDEGQFGVRNALPGEARGQNMTADERNQARWMSTFGMDEQTALLAATGRLRPEQAQSEARSMALKLIDPSDAFAVRRFTRSNPETAAEMGITEQTEPMRATQILQDHYAKQFSSQSITQGYGIPGPGGPAPASATATTSPPGLPAASPQQQGAPQGDGSSAQSPLDASTLTARPPAGTYIRIAGRQGVRDGVYRVERSGSIRRVAE